MAKRHFLVFRKFYYNRADWNSIHEILDSLKWIIWKISHYVGSNSWRMECLACKGCPICTYCAIIFIPWQEELRLKDDQKTRSGLIKSVVFCASWNFHDSELCLLAYLLFHRLLRLGFQLLQWMRQTRDQTEIEPAISLRLITLLFIPMENAETAQWIADFVQNKSCF